MRGVVRPGPSPFVLLAFGPILVAAFAWSASLGQLVRAGAIAELAGGLLLWTLLEYVFHRFLFHIVPSAAWLRERQQHLLHHQTPEEPAYYVVPLWISLPVAVAVWALLRAAVGSWPRAALMTAGVILGYLAYELVHYRVHRAGGGGLVRFWRRHHFYHHYADDHRCYGFTTPLWDNVFGTGPRRSRAVAESTR